MFQFILASSSPRRSEILSNLNIPFKQIVSTIDEDTYTMSNPIDLVQTLSLEKAKSVKIVAPDNAVIIAADTVVCCGDIILGKPSSDEDAFTYLRMLSGNAHKVYTGITIINANKHVIYTDFCMTKVHMRQLSDREINGYIHTREPFDKAGAFGIQGYGSALVSKIDGDYFNVVGLPVSKLIEGLSAVGIDYFDSFHK